MLVFKEYKFSVWMKEFNSSNESVSFCLRSQTLHAWNPQFKSQHRGKMNVASNSIHDVKLPAV